jgi:hypothetical protein
MALENVEVVRAGFEAWNAGGVEYFWDHTDALEAVGLAE